jgi:hypothetical protein
MEITSYLSRDTHSSGGPNCNITEHAAANFVHLPTVHSPFGNIADIPASAVDLDVCRAGPSPYTHFSGGPTCDITKPTAANFVNLARRALAGSEYCRISRFP